MSGGTDGPAIAHRLVAVVEQRWSDALAVDDRGPVDPAADGALAAVVEGVDGPIAEVYVQPDRARVEFRAAPDRAAAAATEAGLRVRPKAVRPPRTLVFVESGAAVKRAADVVAAVAASR
jgi:hypothetical protein